jgi:hypothetical protein
MLDVMINDDTNAWDLLSDGRYVLRKPFDNENPKSSQTIFTIEAQNRAALLQEETDMSKNGIAKSSLGQRLKKVLSSFHDKSK